MFEKFFSHSNTSNTSNTSSAGKKIRRKYLFYGRVQGVGFRYRSKYLAQARGLTGFVENLYDGGVLMEVQGDAISIDLMVQDLQDDTYIEIRNMEVKEIPVIENDRKFGVHDYY